jgi:hypothetical protein
MKHKLIFWLIFITVTLLSWIDNQYFTEGLALQQTDLNRQIGHIVILTLIIPIGYIGWKTYPEKWPRSTWLYSYLFILVLIGTAGLIQLKTKYFTTSFLDMISSIRQFFCSPMPYFIIYLLHRVANRAQRSS